MQGRRREAGSERSVEQTHEPMNKNPIRGIARGTSGQRTTKSIFIKHAGCKSGGCVRKAVEFTSGDLPPCQHHEVGTEHRAIEAEPEGRSQQRAY